MRSASVKGNFRFLVFLWMAACFSTALAGEIIPRERGRLPLGHPTKAIAASGHHAFVAAGGHVLAIDLSQPATPAIVGDLDTPGAANHLVVAANLAYVADGDSGLQIIDLSQPTTPRIIGSFAASACADVAVAGLAVYLLSGFEIKVIDATDPARPMFRTSLTDIAARNIAAIEGVLAATPSGPDFNSARLYDLSDPFNPAPAANIPRTAGTSGIDESIDIEVFGNAVYVIRQHYYVCCEGSFVSPNGNSAAVYDISNPRQPVYREYGGYGHTRAWNAGNYLLTGGGSGLGLFELGPNDGFLRRQGVSGITVDGGGVSLGNHLYVSSGNDLVIYELTPANPRSSATILDGAGVNQVVTRDNFVYAATRSGLKIIDAANPSAPEVIGELTLASPISVLVRDHFAYLSGASGLDTVDISDPRQPRLQSHVDVPLQGIYFLGDRIYSANPPQSGYIVGFDLAMPDAPVLRWPRVYGDWEPGIFGVWRQYIFANTFSGGGGSNVRVIDSTTHTSAGLWPYFGGPVSELHFTDTRAYAAIGGRFRILDMTAAQPVLLNPESSILGGRVTILGRQAYIATGSSLLVVDISQENNPRIVAQSQNLTAFSLANDGRRIHIASSLDGYSIMEPHPQVWMRALTAQSFAVSLDAPPGTLGNIQRSFDLRNWTDWRSLIFGDDPIVREHVENLPSPRFYRFNLFVP